MIYYMLCNGVANVIVRLPDQVETRDFDQHLIYRFCNDTNEVFQDKVSELDKRRRVLCFMCNL